MQVKKDDIQKKILAVSERLFIKNGYENTSLKMIADKSYISKSNIYRYYKSKEEIYETLVGPARTEIMKLMSYFFTDDFIGGMLIMLRNGSGSDRRMIEQEIIGKFIEACPIDDEGAKEMISKILIFGLTNILLKFSDEESITKELNMLIYYHYLGLNGLKEKLGV